MLYFVGIPHIFPLAVVVVVAHKFLVKAHSPPFPLWIWGLDFGLGLGLGLANFSVFQICSSE